MERRPVKWRAERRRPCGSSAQVSAPWWGSWWLSEWAIRFTWTGSVRGRSWSSSTNRTKEVGRGLTPALKPYAPSKQITTTIHSNMVESSGNSMETNVIQQKSQSNWKKALIADKTDCLLSSGYKRSRLTDDTIVMETEVTTVESKETNV